MAGFFQTLSTELRLSVSKRRLALLAAALLVVVGGGLCVFDLFRPITLYINGQPQSVRAPAFTVAEVLRFTGIQPAPEDRLIPPPDTSLPANRVIHLVRARPVTIQDGLTTHSISSSAAAAGNLLLEAGIRLFPGDRLAWNGSLLLPGAVLPADQAIYLQLRRAQPVTFKTAASEVTFYSSRATLGEALWEAGYHLAPADRVSLPLTTTLDRPLSAQVVPGRQVEIEIAGKTLLVFTSALTTGQLLAQAGIALSSLDISFPPASEPLPADGKVRVVRVREEITLEQTLVPFKSLLQPDPQTELDQRRVVDAGRYGIRLSRTRSRFENGVQVSSQKEAEWEASMPKDQVNGYGTKVAVRSLDTPEGALQYWRAVPVYATSYSPCRQGLDRCSKSTASGTPLDKGVIAVTVAWYRQMAGQRVYIPGYGVGVIADTGGGIPGRYWIDLGFSEDNFELWHQNVTMYFLTPVPPAIPWILP